MDFAPSWLCNNPLTTSFQVATQSHGPARRTESLVSAGWRKRRYQPPPHRPPGLEVQEAAQWGRASPVPSPQDGPTRKSLSEGNQAGSAGPVRRRGGLGRRRWALSSGEASGLSASTLHRAPAPAPFAPG